MSKVVVIGWDAADWQLIEPLLAEGKMPALKSLMENGVSGNIATLNPPLSPILWTSIATGKRAYQHGIHGFVETDPVSGAILPVKATSRKVKAVWNILNEAGLKCNVINWWPSHPAEVLDGVCVSNQFYTQAPTTSEDWSLSDSAVYPTSLKDLFKSFRVHPGELNFSHLAPFLPDLESMDIENDYVLQSVMAILAKCASIHNVATYVIENTEWDFTAVYFEAIDHFSHLAMKYHPPQLKEVSDSDFKKYHQVVSAAYQFHDMMLQRMLELAGSDCHVLLVSDHGFQSKALREPELPDLPAAPALEHRKYGVLVAGGPDISNTKKVFGASLLDITPTILHLFGLPVGDDMEGRVLKDIFKENREIGQIASWELTKVRAQFVLDDGGNDSVLNQLEDLGYVNLPKDKKQEYVAHELAYNLALSYVDGNKLEEAESLCKKLWAEGADYRFALLWARVSLVMGNIEELQSKLTEFKKLNIPQTGFIYIEGLLHLQENKAEEALACFKNLEVQGLQSVELFLEIAKAFFITARLRQAKDYYQKALALETENSAALSGFAQCLVEEGKNEEALSYLEKSLELQYFQPQAHFVFGQAAKALRQSEVAKKAFEVCLAQAPKHKKAQAALSGLVGATSAERPAPVMIVSGMPRSGTSLLMKMLHLGGLPIFSDAQRPEDEHNPKGYFEHELVKSIGVNSQWITNCRAKVVKIVSPLLRYLPASEQYYVLWVKRPLTEVIVSQEIMKGKKKEEVMRGFPFEMAAALQTEEQRLEHWLKTQPHVKFIEVNYYDCLEKPAAILEQISRFTGQAIQVEKGILAVDENLHRNKLGKS